MVCAFEKKIRDGSMIKTCGLLAQDGSKFCPRHTFLHNVKQQQTAEKEQARRDKLPGMPSDRVEMIRRGYTFTGTRNCSDCGKLIEWWKTPNGRMAPYELMPEENSHSRSHFAGCVRQVRRTA